MIDFVLIAICTAGLSVFLQHCYNEGNVLSGYFNLIARLPWWLFKPLGGCVSCQNFWIVVFAYGFTYGITNIKDLFMIMLMAGASYLTLHLTVLRDDF